MRTAVVFAASLSLTLLAWAGPARAADPDQLGFGVAVFDLLDLGEEGNKGTVEGRVELRFGGKIWGTGEVWRGIGPLVGVMANADGGVLGYAGIYADFRFAQNIVLQPFTSVGGYRQGDSIDLGGVLQFQSGLLLGYRFDSGHQLGVYFNHTSNSGLGDTNHGVDALGVMYSLPFGRLF